MQKEHGTVAIQRYALCALAGLGLAMAGFMSLCGAPDAEAHNNALVVESALPQATRMATGAVTTPPPAHALLCAADPATCIGGGADRIVLDSAQWQALVAINARFNRAIAARQDMEIHGQSDVWTVGGRYGDCEDYSLAKRAALIDAGIPASAMSLAVVRIPDGTGHAVLVVRTDRGDFALDNRRADIRGWQATGYRWYKITDAANPVAWVDVRQGKAGRVMAAVL